MGTKRFAISFRDLDTISTWLATLLGGGPDRARVEVDPEEIRVRMGGVRANIPRGSVHRIVLTVRRGPHLGFDGVPLAGDAVKDLQARDHPRVIARGEAPYYDAGWRFRPPPGPLEEPQAHCQRDRRCRLPFPVR
jgi:hypothetical protein